MIVGSNRRTERRLIVHWRSCLPRKLSWHEENFQATTFLVNGSENQLPDNHRSPYRTDIFIKVSISIQGALMCLDCFGGQTVNSLSSHKNTEWWDWCNAIVQCCNVSLKKSASTYVTEFVPDVVQTVERKMKVDDLIKSATTPKTEAGFRHSNESC